MFNSVWLNFYNTFIGIYLCHYYRFYKLKYTDKWNERITISKVWRWLYIYIYIYMGIKCNWENFYKKWSAQLSQSGILDIGTMVRVFANGPRDQDSIAGRVIPMTQKILFDVALLNARYGSKVKWRNPRKGVAPSPTTWCSSYRKGSLRVTLNYGRQLIYIYIYIVIHRQIVSLYHISSVWLDMRDSQSWDRNSVDSHASRRFYRTDTRKLA